MQLLHLVNLVKVDHEALLHGVVVLDALPAEDGLTARAVEMFDSLIVSFTNFILQRLFIFIDIVEVNAL